MKLRWRRTAPLDHAELTQMLPAPGSFDFAPGRQDLIEDYLMQALHYQQDTAPSRRTRRRLAYAAAPVALVALAGGAVAATSLLGSSPASEPGTVRCYSAASLDSPYTDTAMAQTTGQISPTDISATVTAAIRTCTSLWDAAVIQPGKIGTPAAAGQDPGTTPALIACVLENGVAAVLPGKGCQDLGLAQLADKT
ncbi:hypothetical protein [Streptomyces acidiscabies]|uniref:Uncharacterized protein n=1 Tax=Streptomyces acidiscabies TaxID=42234 RepID=A0ABU4M4F6_9ACTN|nr:hypothetical protein [Streptomyces acidiscabies]MDX3022924.1 hypothetical protein [Streptomyces acidiscabies]